MYFFNKRLFEKLFIEKNINIYSSYKDGLSKENDINSLKEKVSKIPVDIANCINFI